MGRSIGQMIKKECLLIGLFVVFSVLIFAFACALDENASKAVAGGDAQSPGEAIEGTIGINPEELPQTPEEAKEKYLQKEWTKIIANSTLFGPVHRTFTAYPIPFKILFGMPYEFSLTFLFVLIFWVWLALSIERPINAYGLFGMKGFWFSGLLALGISIISAQLKIFVFAANGILTLIMSKESWLWRLVIIIVLFVVLFVLHQLSRKFSKSIKASKEIKAKKELEQKVEKHEAFVKGAEEGQELVSEISK
jgi:hypothetical protein